MNIKFILIILFSVVLFSCNKNGRDEEISQNIEINLKGLPSEKEKVDYSEEIEEKVDGTKLPSSPALIKFYENRDYSQAWTRRKGLNDPGEELYNFLNEVPKYGLNPEWYNMEGIKKRLDNKKPSSEQLAQIDILLTDAYLQLASHLAYGARDFDNSKIVWKWKEKGEKGELPELLQQAWDNDNITESLIELQPNWFEYLNLQKGIENFISNNEINKRKYIIPGLKEDSVQTYNKISEILVKLNLLDKGQASSYDAITESLKEFQKWHGIPVDGIVGDYTLEALAMSTMERYNRIALNLDRMRSEISVPDEFVLVNIPAYHLKYVEENKVKKTFDVIVGTPEDPTPVMTDEMEYIETFPYWHVPVSIVTEEILPKIKDNPAHMSNLGYRIIDNNNNEIDPIEVDLSNYSPENFEYSIRQDGDSSNALGLVKFMFPNKKSIYIHDTPSRHLFGKDMRSFSHGCIRINEPLQFADLILKEDNNKYTAEDIKTMIINKNNNHVKLNKHLPVLIRYYTAEADANGNIYLYKDIYEKDKNLLTYYSEKAKALVSMK